MATLKQVNDWIDRIAPIAVEKSNSHNKKIYPSVCIAQSCVESAFGTSPKMQRANAVFGIKVGKSKAHWGKAWNDKAYSTKTKECYDGKTYTQITDFFRAYESLENSVEDYYDMLCNCQRYKKALNQQSPKACIEGIQQAPYATDPKYVNTILNIIKKYNLEKYDSILPVLQKGSKGEHVILLQKLLNNEGAHLTVDGHYGVLTFNAVIDFQAIKGLKKDGIVGVNTWKALGLS